MDAFHFLSLVTALAPAVVMALGVLVLCLRIDAPRGIWHRFRLLCWAALAFAAASTLVHAIWPPAPATAWFAMTPLTSWMALLVQALGTVIGVFSTRYLQGEPGQPRYAAALSGVLASVHGLLLANHWLVLIAAWALIGAALQYLLCFYPDRPFALLAAHKKRIADRLADGLLLLAAGLAWSMVGSGSLSELAAHLAEHGASPALQWSAVCLSLAVILRTALFPIHGWLIQVMEAPTPVSALLHAGVVNLGGYVLIRFSPLLESVPAARWLLVISGLATAVLAGLVMLTRISIKVRLAWSTVAQMGFMMLECGLGLYSLAVLHLIGHSLYKAHAFLAASNVVRESRLRKMRGTSSMGLPSLLAAPLLALGMLLLIQGWVLPASWPWWWNAMLALAWAPFMWVPSHQTSGFVLQAWRLLAGMAMVTVLSLMAGLAHLLPTGLTDAPNHGAGVLALAGMAAMYLALILLQSRPEWMQGFRRASYAGFYVDEFYTRLTLWLWPAQWTPTLAPAPHGPAGRTGMAMGK